MILRRVAVIAAVTGLCGGAAMPLSASAEDEPPPYEVEGALVPGIVVEEDPVQTDVSVDFGWVTATIYFNRTETNRLASHVYTAAAICGAVGWAGGPGAAFACLLGYPRLVAMAANARAQGRCIGLRFVIPNPQTWWTVYHNGGRC